MSDALHGRIAAVLATWKTMTLATSDETGRPWAATVFYASDADLNLYFVSDEKTRHGRDLCRTQRVAAAINADAATWDEVIGVQLEGEARVLDGAPREAALSLYLDKFPAVRRLFDAPRGLSERLIAARLRSTSFWCLVPQRIRLVDNREGFGWKRELVLPPAQ